MPPRTLLQADDVRRAIVRMAHELIETAPDGARFLVLGIPTRGAVLAARLASAMSGIAGEPVPVGTLDVTLYRDDLGSQPTRPTGRTDVPADVDGATVVLVDDVLFSGRTVRAALDALTALGRPAVVRLPGLLGPGGPGGAPPPPPPGRHPPAG